jgi:hypothetical protein
MPAKKAGKSPKASKSKELKAKVHQALSSESTSDNLNDVLSLFKVSPASPMLSISFA